MKKIILITIWAFLSVLAIYAQPVFHAGTRGGPFTYSGQEEIGGIFYHQLTLTVPLDIRISYCNSSILSCSVSLTRQGGSSLSLSTGKCSDNSSLPDVKARNVPAGTYLIMTDCYGHNGVVRIFIEGTTPRPDGDTREIAINAGIHSTDFVYTNTQNTTSFSNEYKGQSTNDIFYKFTLNVAMDVTISHCGSSLADTYMHLLNSSGTRIAYNNDYSGEGACSNTKHAYLKMENLAAGTYYIVSEGYSANGSITTRISGVKSSPTPVPTANSNYIMTVTPTVASADASRLAVDKAIYNIQYFDGLGRPVQNIQPHFNSEKADLVTYQQYDAFGRESNSWLPVIAADNKGAFMSYTTFAGKVPATYSGESKAYSNPVYEASPLNRVVEQYGPGQGTGSVKMSYLSNVSGVDTLNCIRYSVSYSSSSDTTLTITRSGNYATGQLSVTRVADEDGHTAFEFKDKLGRVVLTRQVDRNGNSKVLYDTYYIYDKYGNLSAVLPPLLADRLQTGTSWLSTTDIIKQYAYLYGYDYRNRCKSKKLPGCSWVLYIYDKADRLIFTQDGNQRLKSPREWTFTIPDVHGRIVLTGVCTSTPNVNTVNNAFVCATYPQSGSGSFMGYNLSGITLSGHTILVANYYDHYKFRSLAGFSNTSLAYDSSGIAIYLTRYGTDAGNYQHKGLLTGTAVAQLNGASTAAYLYSVMYYDDRGQLVQAKSTNHLPGGIDREYIAYNFTGQPVSYRSIHAATGKTTFPQEYTYSYDHVGRLESTKYKLSTESEITLTNNIYDGLGRLSTSTPNNQATLRSTYSYDIRSRITRISGSHFIENLTYNKNSNIKSQQWTQAGKTRTYAFTYDHLSRLKSASYTGDGQFGTNYVYDKHGNMTALLRNGYTGTSTFGAIDNLTMTYSGNQLSKVEDSAVVPTISSSGDFRNDVNVATEYFYDANGNLTRDLNKGVSRITYNSLNLPQSLTITNSLGSATNTYVYAADGAKLSVTKGTFKTDYVKNIIYENNSLKRILVEGGYYELGQYYFYIRDHLGNNRIVANKSGTIIQSTQYYPFGMAYADGTGQSSQPYKYNGKELDTDRGLNLYDYSARYMEPALGRFTTVDPLAEKYYSVSPYVYCANNPVRYIDPKGESIWDFLLGAVHSICSNLSMGTIPTDTKDVSNASHYNSGRSTRDVISMAMGAAEVYVGGNTAMMGTATFAVTAGSAAPASAAMVAGGAAVATHGGAVIINAANSLKKEEGRILEANSSQNERGARRKNWIPDTGEPNTVRTNSPGTTKKKYGSDGKVQKEFNKGHTGSRVSKKERSDHIHDYKPNPYDPDLPGERQPGRPLKRNELIRDFRNETGN